MSDEQPTPIREEKPAAAPVELPVSRDVIERLTAYRAAAAQLEAQASAFVAGLGAGAGFDPARLLGVDDEKNVLLLAPATDPA